MPQENLDAIRRVYERWSEGDFQSPVDLFDPLVLFVMRPEFPDAGTYLGLESLAKYTRGFLEPWSGLTIDAEEIIDAQNSVIAAVCQRGTGGGSGAVTEFRYFQVWTFRGDKVIRLENVRERAEALAAAGLAE
jgi:ketosteroid isomerase-like protein